MSLQVKSPSRVVAVDIVRVFAMVMMVQGHTLDVLLTPASQYSPWYKYWLFCRGFTAPMFMTLSGFGFALATLRHWENHLHFSSAVAKRLRRFGFFVVLGYSLRIPVHSLRDLRWQAQMPGTDFYRSMFFRRSDSPSSPCSCWCWFSARRDALPRSRESSLLASHS